MASDPDNDLRELQETQAELRTSIERSRELVEQAQRILGRADGANVPEFPAGDTSPQP